MAKIKEITAYEIFNGNGFPSVEVTVSLSDGITGSASSPSGVVIGNYDAAENRDHDMMRFGGMGVLKAVATVKNDVAPKLIGMEANHQQEIDRALIELDGTQNKSKLGSNVTLSVSMAVAKAAAASSVLPLFLYLREYIDKTHSSPRIPTPIFSLINGGKHGNETLDFQEFLLVPASSKSFDESMQIGYQVYESVKELIRINGFSTLVGTDGGFGPKVANNYDALSFLVQGIDNTSVRLGYDAFLGIDAAASSYFKSTAYKIHDKNMTLNARQLNSYYQELIKTFHMLYIEDPFAQDDWDGWTESSSQLSNEVTVVGDDLIATNPYRLQMAMEKKCVSGVVIKPGQAGTVIEALAVVEVARAAGLKIVVSGRAIETNDDFIAEFSVAASADYVRFGSFVRGEHAAKYNKLLRINERLKQL